MSRTAHNRETSEGAATPGRTDLLEALRAGWWILPVVVAAAVGCVAYLTSDEPPPVYQTTATLAAVPHPSIGNEREILRSLDILERRTMVATLARVPASRSVLRGAAERLATTLDELGDYEVRTSVIPSTHLIRLTVKGPDPALVSRYAIAVIRKAAEDASSYYPVFALRILEGPGGPGRSVDRGTTRYYAVAGLLGLFLGLLAAYGVGLLSVARNRRNEDVSERHPHPASQRRA